MKLVNILTILGGISTTYAMTVQELIKDMGVGWNLGNTLEACGDWINGSTVKQYETSWGNPETTEEMIKGIKSYGFKSIRVPVAWSNLIASDYTINPLLLARAKEIVNYIINNDMYAIMNIHWDNGWFENFATKEEESFTKYRRIWEQISDYFKDVNENLIFESLNEEGCWNTVWNRWSNQGDKSKAYGLLNEMNQNFVDIVRNSGGNNTERHLLLAGYCTDIDLTIDEAYVVPKDDRVMVSVHYYTPSTFTILEEDADWGKAQPTWGSESEVEYLLNDFKKIKTRFVDNGIPVVIGEYGTVTKNKDINSVHKFLKTVAETSLNSGMCPFLWDNGEHFNRKTLVFRDEAIGEIYKVML
ncbi:endoglucanase [Piromyces finnis]|uniref:Endoglucanase n=1 Tax=Piromyces finnis TaxID=1754191 RepID=A0A1Y1V4G5_9FUNG|nr:endoglucanase [Piromyces finnis]|eukprot:ORX46926.1 endoglucanase [Piromyces finnis]